ncbi:MAG: hypothetical protein K6L74_11755 [Neptuniibacter sp.]
MNAEQALGRSGLPKMAQRKSSVRWLQGIFAGLFRLLMLGTIQQAAQ